MVELFLRTLVLNQGRPTKVNHINQIPWEEFLLSTSCDWLEEALQYTLIAFVSLIFLRSQKVTQQFDVKSEKC